VSVNSIDGIEESVTNISLFSVGSHSFDFEGGSFVIGGIFVPYGGFSVNSVSSLGQLVKGFHGLFVV